MTIRYYSAIAEVPSDFKWSNASAVPSLGDKVRVRVNSLGVGEVRGYFVQEGYLGVMVELDNPPAWWLKQNSNADIRACHVFGAEIETPINPIRRVRIRQVPDAEPNADGEWVERQIAETLLQKPLLWESLTRACDAEYHAVGYEIIN